MHSRLGVCICGIAVRRSQVLLSYSRVYSPMSQIVSTSARRRCSGISNQRSPFRNRDDTLCVSATRRGRVGLCGPAAWLAMSQGVWEEYQG